MARWKCRGTTFKSRHRFPCLVALLSCIALISFIWVASRDQGGHSRSSLRVLAQLGDEDLPDAAPPSKYPGTAIVTLAGGDTSGKHLLALIQSLRDVKTELPIVVLLARGGLGSAACANQTWKEEMNRTQVQCDGPGTIGAWAQPHSVCWDFGVALVCAVSCSRGNCQPRVSGSDPEPRG